MKPLVVFGAGGQVGEAVCQAARRRGVPVRGLTRSACDITDAAAVAAALDGGGVAVNCAAATSVDDAERDPAMAYTVNAGAVAALGVACRGAGIPLIHLSTDYVFDGSGTRPWREDDPTAPVNVYGASKRAGEEALALVCPAHVTLRISWVFGGGGRTFVRTMRELARRRNRLRVVVDQTCRPTPAGACAEAILAIAARCVDAGFDGWGTYHFAGEPAVSRWDFARAILADRADVEIEPVRARDIGDIARRPANAVLDCSRIAVRFGLAMPSWQAALPAAIARVEDEPPA